MENKELEYWKWLVGRVSKKRLLHILSVVKEADYLAQKNGADVYKCRIAALLHDAAKEISLEEMQNLCRLDSYSDLSEQDFRQEEILHGFAAASLVKRELGIQDIDILEAIQYHTIGKEGLSLVAEIVYIADAIEETRTYPNVAEIRELTHQNLKLGILKELQYKEEYLHSIGAKLHPNTLKWKKSLEEGNL